MLIVKVLFSLHAECTNNSHLKFTLKGCHHLYDTLCNHVRYLPGNLNFSGSPKWGKYYLFPPTLCTLNK